MAPASLLVLASAAAANAAAEGPSLDGFNGTFPCDVLYDSLKSSIQSAH